MPTAARFFVPRMEFSKLESYAGFIATGQVNHPGLTLGTNPNLFVQANTTPPNRIRVSVDTDLGDQLSIQWSPYSGYFAGFYVRNAPQLSLTDVGFLVESTSDPSFNTGLTQRLNISLAAQIWSGSLILAPFAANDDKYWQFSVTGAQYGLAKIAMVMVGTYHDIPERWNWGDLDSNLFQGSQTGGVGRRVMSRVSSSEPHMVLQRTFELISTSSLGNLRAAFNASRGAHAPFAYVDFNMHSSLDPKFAKLCRFTANELGETQVAAGLWVCSAGIREEYQLSRNRPY